MKNLTLKELGFGDIAKTHNPQRQHVTKRALEYAKKNLTEINVAPGSFIGNQKCYQNARGILEFQAQGATLIACIAFLPDGRGANLHFVNKTDEPEAHYVDNTLGYQANFIKYYFLNEYTIEELDKNNKIYPHILDELADKYLNIWFTKEELKEFGIGREHF